MGPEVSADRPGLAAWSEVIPLLPNAGHPPPAQLRKALKIRGHVPSDEAATELIYLVLRNIARRWRDAPREWTEAMNRFAILYPDRFTLNT